MKCTEAANKKFQGLGNISQEESMENIELFNKYTAICLGLLYKQFPIPLELKAEIIALKVIDNDNAWEVDCTAAVSDIEESSEYTPKNKTPEFKKHISFVGATINWLTECTYIQISKRNMADTKKFYVLSPKGFEVLSTIPESLQTESYGERLIDATDNLVGEANKTIISETIGHIIGAAFKSSFNM